MAQIDLKPVVPEEAVAYFRQKGYRIGFDHRDVAGQEHQAAYTVAKAMQMDLVRDIRAQSDRALAEGIAFGEFKRALMPGMIDRGWWGRKGVVDPLTGETVSAQLGSASRLRRIFDTNLATAYSEGQAERIEANAGLFPFLEYVRSAAAHPRPTHLAYAGVVLPAGHPWMRAHMPVKEWGCKCTVIQHSAATLRRAGLKVGDAPQEVMRLVVNGRTGEEMQVPVGVDPAFNYPHGGRRANLARMMMDKADASAAATATRVLQDGADTWAPLVDSEWSEWVNRHAIGDGAQAGSRRVAGLLQPDLQRGLKAAGAAPAHATIAMDAGALGELLGQAGAAADQVALVEQLPGLLRRVGEAWLDVSAKRLVMLCTPEDLPRHAVEVTVALDAQLRRDVGNQVRGMRVVDPARFAPGAAGAFVRVLGQDEP
ncbi:phage minor head protein [Pseudacidovorax intermedius]|uniref:phage head morphogenesis protein n=1 Tax=Pseudacidovorax intermedius TaxID=433924 RepID=UPI0026F265C6|nr:phage minor head protein [Pseudacidovorax intermedius]